MKAQLSLWNESRSIADHHTCYLYYNELVSSILQIVVTRNGQVYGFSIKQNSNFLVIKEKVAVTVHEAKRLALVALQDVLLDMVMAVRKMTPYPD